MVREIKDFASLKKLVNSENLLVILFSDDSILTNFAVEPEFDLFAKQNRKYTFAKVDLKEIPEAIAYAETRDITTLNFYKRGKMFSQVQGYDLWSVRGHFHTLPV